MITTLRQYLSIINFTIERGTDEVQMEEKMYFSAFLCE